jgi:hypothetical protein
MARPRPLEGPGTGIGHAASPGTYLPVPGEELRKRFESAVPSLRVRSVDWQNLFAYPLSGGFQPWSLIPGAAIAPMLAIERRLPRAIRQHLAFRIMVVLERL